MRSRGPAWRPAAAPPAAGPSQARKDRPPFGAPPAFFSDRPSPELSGHAPAADSGVEGAVRPHSTRAADSQQPGAVAGWFEPRKQWAASEMPVLAGPSQTPAANTMYSTLGRREDAEAERPAGAPASPSRPTAEQELPALEVPKAGGAAASDGREAHSGGDTAPSTPGPTLTGNAAGPVRNGQAHSWLPESGQGLGEQAGLLDKELVNGQERNGTRGDLPRAASPGEAHQPGAVYTPPAVS